MHRVPMPMPTTSDELFEWVEKWFQPLGERIEALETDVNFHGGINIRFDEFGKFLEKFDHRLKAVEQQLTEILNLGPTITQRKMWMDKLMKIELKEIQNSVSPLIKKLLKLPDVKVIWSKMRENDGLERLWKLK